LEHDFGEVGVIFLKLSQFYTCVLSAPAPEQKRRRRLPRLVTNILVVYTPHVVQGEVDGNPSWVLICCNISKQFCLQWNAFDLLYKIKNILWVVALLEVCDDIKHSHRLGFYQELKIR